MYDNFFKNFESKVLLTDSEKKLLQGFISYKKLRKNQYLLQEGEECRFLAVVEKGAIRQYSIDDNGNTHILQFAIEGWTISDIFSFLTQTPSTYTIEAIEDSEVVLIDRTAHEELLKILPKYETYTRLQLTGAYIALQRRINSSISLSPEDRYNEFIKQYAHFFQRFPQHMIASYLGLRPETLSRIRAKMTK